MDDGFGDGWDVKCYNRWYGKGTWFKVLMWPIVAVSTDNRSKVVPSRKLVLSIWCCLAAIQSFRVGVVDLQMKTCENHGSHRFTSWWARGEVKRHWIRDCAIDPRLVFCRWGFIAPRVTEYGLLKGVRGAANSFNIQTSFIEDGWRRCITMGRLGGRLILLQTPNHSCQHHLLRHRPCNSSAENVCIIELTLFNNALFCDTCKSL